MKKNADLNFRTSKPRILVLDDERMIRWSLRSCFEEAGAEVEEATNLAEAREQLKLQFPDLAVLDLKLPDGSGLEILKEIAAHDPELPVLIITAYGSLQGAVEAMRLGAFDYVTKPFDFDDLMFTAKRALERSELLKIAVLHQRGAGKVWPIAESPASKQLLAMLEKVGRSGAATVLLTGASGVGKGLAAKFLHHPTIYFGVVYQHS